MILKEVLYHPQHSPSPPNNLRTSLEGTEMEILTKEEIFIQNLKAKYKI